MLAKQGSRAVHSIEPDQRKHLSVLSCINAAGGCIPNFYILKGSYFLEDYIARCEAGAVMGMQPNAWMTRWLFKSWISHFIQCLRKGSGIDLSNRHMLILDEHNSHVTLEVVRTAMESGLDIKSLPSHTSHALQPLDVACFAPFKTAFRKQRDAWMVLHKNSKVGKQDLCEWTSKALQLALIERNIKLGFRKTGIWPFDCDAAKRAMAHAVGFQSDIDVGSTDGHCTAGKESDTLAGVGAQLGRYPPQASDAARGEAQFGGHCCTCGLARAQCTCGKVGHASLVGARVVDVELSSDSVDVAPAYCSTQVDVPCKINVDQTSQEQDCTIGSWEPVAPKGVPHFYVKVPGADDNTYDVLEWHVAIDPTFHAHLQEQEEDNISQFFALPEVIPAIKRKRAQPFMDFTKSKILTSAKYTQCCEDLLAQRLAHEAKAKRKAALKEANRETRLREKEERQREEWERAIAKEAQRQKRQRLESERQAAGGRRGRQGVGEAPIDVVPTVPLSPPNLPSVPLASPQISPPLNTSLNPLSTPLYPPSYFYNRLLLLHLFPGGASSLSVNDSNVNGRIPWIGSGAWELRATGTDQRIPRNFS